MKSASVTKALANISAENDPTLKAQMLASLVSAAFRERGIELVVVGGSAIEFYTEGAYASGDVDMCVLSPARPIPLRFRQEVMGELGGQGGPRSWEVAGLFVDLLGVVEKEARTPVRQLQGPSGIVNLIDPEELLVERVLVSVYPQPNQSARDCARQLIGVALTKETEMDWQEVLRLANKPAYRVLTELKQLIREVSDELKVQSPLDSN